MKLWLDDVRPPPDDTWTWVRTSDAAVDVLKGGQVKCMSFDHDLGGSRPSGYIAAAWLEANPEFLPDDVTVHSQNPVGARRIRVALDSARRRKNEERGR